MISKNIFCLTGALLFAAASVINAETITVNTSSDVTDFGGARTVSDLPGPDGLVSLAEAGIASDNTPGVQTIAFNVPQADWQFQWLYPGRVVLRPFLGFRVFEPVIIDATTQTASTGDTNPDGGEVVVWGGEVYLNGDDSTIRGFDNTSINVTGSNCVAEANTGTTNISVFNGNGNLIQDNVGGTIKIDRSNGNVIVGNTVQRVRILGFVSEFGTGPATNNRVGGPNPEDRNFITGYGTINGEGLPGGTTVQLFDATGTVVENNWIGTTPDGLAQGSLASVIGIGFEGECHDTDIRNNRIAGILGHGQGPHHAGQLFGWAILVGGSGSDVNIVGNTIGLDANGDPNLGSVWGIDVGDARFSTVSNIQIGGSLPGEGNVVAGHLLNGVTVGHNVPQVRISRTSIYENGWLGIDLIPDGFGYDVTPNDLLDTDAGGNGLQNFPTIATASRQGAAINVTGSLHSEPVSEYTLEFFGSPACDDSGFGEGH
ncbi:MAG: hypothetical protein KDA99_15800, partial [Planctomycetales bacterium]|nr:hypothetical protein [Planctomycetales bacterium]